MSRLQADVRRLVARLREERLAQGVKQHQIADMVGVPNSMISHIESGSVPDPKASVVLAYLTTLGGRDWLDRALPRSSGDDADPAVGGVR